MHQPHAEDPRLAPGLREGRTSAVAGRCARDLQGCAARYPSLFPQRPFDPALFATVAMANAFCAPWLDADQLRMANRATLWAFGVDWLIDYCASSAAEVDDIVDRCVAVADGGPPRSGDPITEFLADIHTGLAAAPAFDQLAGLWRQEFRLMLDAMAREWNWHAAAREEGSAALPSFAEYLDNADNICFSFVFTSHWIINPDGPPQRHAAEVRTAARAVQQVIRLLNDLGTYERDLAWGDLSPLMLGVSRDDVLQASIDLERSARDLLLPLHDTAPRLSDFLNRYMGFNRGFYSGTDYWGDL